SALASIAGVWARVPDGASVARPESFRNSRRSRKRVGDIVHSEDFPLAVSASPGDSASLGSCPARLRATECVEARDNVKQLRIDRGLPEAIERAMQLIGKMLDVFLGPLHGLQPAGMLTRERFRAGLVEADEQVLVDQRWEIGNPSAQDFRE